MRVTENTNFDTIRDSISRSRGRMENLQLQSSTLKKLNSPSDDPVGAAKVLETRTDKVNNDQFQMNAKMAEAFLNNSEHAVSELADIVVRAKEIAIGQSSGASSNAESRLGVAEEVAQLYQQAVAAANRRIGDRYLFGGHRTNHTPVDPDGRYQGDEGQMMVEVGRDVFISTNVPGIEVFNTIPKSSLDSKQKHELYSTPRAPASEMNHSEEEQKENVNVFDELQNLRISLLTGDLDGIRSTLERFDAVHGQLTSIRAKIGARVQGLQNTIQSLERHTVTNAELASSLEDADMAQVMSDLAKEETVFRSALSSSHKLIQPTLLDFLK
jgi:flagellar hook-associated protein 3 FlgL